MNVLVLNAGSSSLKFDLYATDPERLIVKGEAERVTNMKAAFASVFTQVQGQRIDAAGHRIVHGGEKFHDAVLIDSAVEKEIEALGTPCAAAQSAQSGRRARGP